MQSSVISAQFNDFSVLFTNDAFINATSIAKQFDKQPRDFLKSEQTQEYITALAQNLSVKRKVLTKENQLVIVKQGGKLQGTWLHPKLAIFFARWLSAEFAVWCDAQIENILGLNKPIDTINPAQQYQIKEAVMQLARKTGKRHPSIYHDLYNHFKIPRYQDLLAKDFQVALKFLEWSEPKQITHDENVILIPFGLLRDATYQVWVRNGKAQKRSVVYAESARDIGTPWGSDS